MSRACCERCWYREGLIGIWDAQKKFWGVCKHCQQYEWCALDAGYSWVSGTYGPEKMDAQARLKGATQIVAEAGYGMRLLSAQQQGNVAQCSCDVFDEMVTANRGLWKPGKSEYVMKVKDRIREKHGDELKGFIFSFLFMAVLSFVIQKILEMLWQNYTATPKT